MDYANAGPSVAYAADVAQEVRPLEEIRSLAEELGRINHTVSCYLERFNGPTPEQLSGQSATTAPMPPPNYRTDLSALRNAVQEAGALADRISRLG